MGKLTTAQLDAATARGAARMRGPRAESVHYDAGRNRVVVRLTTGIEMAFVPRRVEGLQHASAADLKTIELEAFGLGIHFPKLDVDLYVPALLKGVLGSKRWMAALCPAASGSKDRTSAPPRRSRTRAGASDL